MKKIVRLISVVVIAMALMIAFSGVVSASQPVCPPPETESVKTVTQISCNGMMTEQQKISWETSNEDLINNPPLATGAEEGVYFLEEPHEVVGKMDYYQDLKVTDGTTNFIKDTDIDTGTEPNLNMMKSIGYGQGDTIGSLSHNEEVSMGIVAAPTQTEEVILCPFASRATEGWWYVIDTGEVVRFSVLPASCVDVEASSSMVVTEVLATTVTKVEISESPIDMHYEVDATGLGGAGTPAVGNIESAFEVYTEDGSAWTDTHCDQGTPADYTLGSKLSHYEKSTANGLWEFHTSYDYRSVIRP
jgi:hypothetical protein